MFRKKLTISPFCGATDTPVWTSGDICSWFQSQGGSICYELYYLCAMIFLRFTFFVTPADLLMVSLVAESFVIQVPAHIQALVGLGSGIEHVCDRTHVLPTYLSPI